MMTNTKAAVADNSNETSTEMQTEAEIVPFPAGSKESDFAKQLRASADTLLKSGGGMKAVSSGRNDIYKLNPHLINVREGFNCRDYSLQENIDHVMTTARSIAEIGVQEPLTVYTGDDGLIYLVNGECRLRATFIAINDLGAEIMSIPVKVQSAASGKSEADLIVSQFILNGGKPFSPMEAATNFLKLVGFGWTEAEIAKRTGYEIARIKQILTLVDKAPEEVQEMIKRGEISMGLAQQVLGASSTTNEATKVLKKAVKDAKSKGKTRATAKNVGGAVGQKLNKLKTVAEIFQEAKVSRKGDAHHVLTLDNDSWYKVQELLGIQ